MKKNGFTLIELLLVLAIVSIMAAIAIPALFSQKDKANKVSMTSVIADSGPPDKIEKVGSGYDELTFIYYKQSSNYYKIYTIKNGVVINESEKKM